MLSSFTESLRTLQRNSILLLTGRVSAQLLSIVFIVLTARRLGPFEFGQFTIAATIVLVGNTFTTFGTDTLLIREIAKAGHVTSLVGRALTLQIVLSVLWILVSVILQLPPVFILYSISLLPLAFFSVASALLRAFERMDLFWALSLVQGAMQIIAILFSRDILTLFAFLLAGHFATALIALWICSASLPHFSLLPPQDFRPLFKLTLPFAVLMTLSILLQRFGVLSVSVLIGGQATGLFSTAARILEGVKLGHYAVLGALLPALSRGIQNSRQTSYTALAGLLGFSILVSITVTLTAHPIILFLFGDAYTSAVVLLKVLIWSLVPYSISAWLSVEMVAHGHEGKLLTATVINLPITVLLFFSLITKQDLIGAAWATLIGELTFAFILMFMQRKHNHDNTR